MFFINYDQLSNASESNYFPNNNSNESIHSETQTSENKKIRHALIKIVNMKTDYPV